MNIAKLIRAKEIWELLRVDSIAASGDRTSNIIELLEAVHLALTVEGKYNASATAGITIEVQTSPDNKNWDTDALTSFSPSFTAGSTVRKTVFIDPDAMAMRVKVTNSDTSYAVTNIRVRATITKEEVMPDEG